MSLRTRHYLTLFALFAGFGAANATFFYFIVRSELAWGVSEESKSRALCLAAYVGRNLSPADPAFEPSLGAAFRRMNDVAGGLRIFWFEATETEWKGVPLHSVDNIPPPPIPDGLLLSSLRNGEATAQFVARDNEDSDLCYGYAPVFDKDGKMRAILAISSLDTFLRTEARNFVMSCLGYCVLAALMGLAVAELLTQIAKRGIAKVQRDAEVLARGDYSAEWEQSRITEINDLNNTLRTIAQVLQEGIRQTWRRFFQAELLPRQEEIAMDCREFCDNASLALQGAPALAIKRLNGGKPGDFWGLEQKNGLWRIVAGNIDLADKEPEALGQVVRANAARDYLLGCPMESDELWTRASKVFPYATAAICAGAKGQKLPFATCLQGKPSQGSRGVLGTVDESALATAREYLAQFPDLPVVTLADKLATILPSDTQGLILIFDFE